MEKSLGEVKDKLPADKVADVEAKVKSLREAIEAEDLPKIRAGVGELEAAMKEIAEAAYSAASAGGNGAPAEGAAGQASTESQGGGDDDVIDAEFEDSE